MENADPLIWEKRVCDRFGCHGKVILSGINRDERIAGVIVNFSRNGLCILSERPAKVGSGIIVRLAGQTEIDPAAEVDKPRSVAVAEVKCCQRIEKDYAVTYRLGLKYLIDI
jgi:hypothetical protein